MNKWNAETLAELLCESAKIAVSYKNKKHAELKKDMTIVTAADKAVEDFLTSALEDEKNDSRIIGEETYSRHSGDYIDKARTAGTAWIIDPIDGTAMYANDIPLWGVSIGYAEDGIIKEGGIILPETGEMLISSCGTTLYAGNVGKLCATSYKEHLKELERPDINFGAHSIIGLSQKATRGWTTTLVNNTVNTFCSSVYEGILLATGRHAASLTSAKLWDNAGYISSLKNLGFTATDLPCGGNIMNMKIDEATYILDYTSSNAFGLTGPTVISSQSAIAEKVMSSFKILENNSGMG